MEGMKRGLGKMIDDVGKRVAKARGTRAGEAGSGSPGGAAKPALDDEIGIGRIMSAIEAGDFSEPELAMLRKQWQSPASQPPVLGITGTGGAGKSSVTDELLNRFLDSFPQMRIAVLSVDPTRRRPGGAHSGRPPGRAHEGKT